MISRTQVDEAEDQAGQAAQGRSEDDGHNASHIHLDGDVASLTAVHLTADHTLGILDRDAALCVRQNDDEDHGSQGPPDQCGQEDVELRLAVACTGQNVGDSTVDAGPAGHDTGENHQRDTIADTLGIDLVAQPSAQLRSCREGQDDNNSAEDACEALSIGEGAHVADDEVVADGQHQTDTRANIVGDAAHLALAFFAFLGEVFQIRNGYCQQLHDDGGIDGGLDTQGEKRTFAQSSAAHHVQILQHIAGTTGEHGGQRTGTDVRHRNCAAQTEQDEDQKGEKKPLAEIIDLPCITEGFKHLTSPQPSRQLSRFFLWRRPCKRQP